MARTVRRTTVPIAATGLVLALAVCLPPAVVGYETAAASAVVAAFSELAGPPTCC